MKDENELARPTVGRVVREWPRKDSPYGQRQNPPRCPLEDSKGWIAGGSKLECCLALGRSRFKAYPTINCQL